MVFLAVRLSFIYFEITIWRIAPYLTPGTHCESGLPKGEFESGIVGVEGFYALQSLHYGESHGQNEHLVDRFQDGLSHYEVEDGVPGQNAAKGYGEKYDRVGPFAPKGADDGAQ